MAAAGLILAACSKSGLNEPSGEWGDAPLRITASVNEEITTRADEPFPSDVDFYFTYTPSGQSYYNSKPIFFDAKGDDQEIYLNWENVQISSNLYFVLDNVPKEDASTSNSIDLTKIPDKEDQKEDQTANRNYNAQPESGTGKGNDILWQRIAVPTKPNTLEPIHFELQHLMSKVSFEISSSNDEIKNLLKLGETTVKLWNVVEKPKTDGNYTFDRIKGTVTIDGELINQDNAVSIAGKEATSEEDIVSVTTDSWIFPPQEFRDKNNRPKLQVCITDETDETKTFTGTLPESMMIEIEDETNEVTSKPLEFLPGYHLVIRVKLGYWTDHTIYFKPVLVKKWKEYGPSDININQVGVYDAEGLTELVKAWNDESNTNLLTFKKYGVLEGDIWTFNLWKSITGYNSDEAIPDKLGFNPRSDYSLVFNSNGHKVNDTPISNFELTKSQTAK